MNTQQILSIVALGLLAVALAVSMSKMKQAKIVSALGVFLAVAAISIGQVTKSQSNYKMLHCEGSCPPSIPPQPPMK